MPLMLGSLDTFRGRRWGRAWDGGIGAAGVKVCLLVDLHRQTLLGLGNQVPKKSQKDSMA